MMNFRIPVVSLLLGFALTATAAPKQPAAKPAASPAAEVPDPPELVGQRTEYEQSLQPLTDKLAAALKARGAKYAADLQTVEGSVTASGNVDLLATIRSEKEAYAAGRGTCGYGENDKRIPPAARELRQAYERDTTKLRTDAIAGARPLVEKYEQKLGDLERKYIGARNPDGVLAVQKERRELQDSAADPFYGGDKAIVGEWEAADGNKIVFRQDKTFSNKSFSGQWSWVDRGKRKVFAKAKHKWEKDFTYTILADGWGVTGKEPGGEQRSFSRVK